MEVNLTVFTSGMYVECEIKRSQKDFYWASGFNEKESREEGLLGVRIGCPEFCMFISRF